MNKKILKYIIYLYIFIIIIYFGLYVYALITPKFIINTRSNITMYDNNNEEFFKNSDLDENVNLEDISINVKNAIISVEDKNFYKHNGFDYVRIIIALFTNIKSGSIKEGASTISQQYIKNLYLDFNQTWKRKIKEAYLTFELEVHYTKDEILEGYLNTIDFGAGNYGIKNAAKYYFNKLPKDLTLAESSLLVGIPKNPTYYNPITNYNNAKKRQLVVLKTMVENNYISENELNEAYNEEIVFYAKNDTQELSSIYYYQDAVINELNNIDEISNSIMNTSGLKIYTSLDKNAQSELEKNINTYMSDTTMQVASVIIKPSTGEIISLIGGKDYNTSQYNRVVSSKRQVGSTIKPFLYYAALENGFTASTTFLSEPTSFNTGNNFYSPKNAGGIYAGKNISMLSAISYSDNIYAMKTHFYLGLDVLGNTTKKAGIKTIVNNNPSSALGTTEINMLDYANGYITLANLGIHKEPYLIKKITDENDNILYERINNEEYVLNKKYVYIINNLLTSTYNYSLINYTSPTMISISNILNNNKYAIKSGSTKSDYLTIGYNKDYLVMVWNGNDDNSNVKTSESKITKYIWANTISTISTHNSWYDIPEGIVGAIIDPISGELSLENGIVCYYEKGSEPNYNSLLHNLIN